MAFFKRSKQGSTSAATNDDTAKQSEQTAQSNAESDASKPEASSLWNRVRHGLKKTRDVLRTDIRDIFKSEGQLVDDEFLNRLFAILVKTDMGARPAAEIRDNIEAKFSGRVIEFEQALDEIRNHLKELVFFGGSFFLGVPFSWYHFGVALLLLLLLLLVPLFFTLCK